MANNFEGSPVKSETGFSVGRFVGAGSDKVSGGLGPAGTLGVAQPVLYLQKWLAPVVATAGTFIAAGTAMPNTTTVTYGLNGIPFSVASGNGVTLDSGASCTCAHARVIKVTPSAVTSTFSVTVTGYDRWEIPISETIQSAGSAVSTNKAFKTVTQIVVQSDADDSLNTFGVGTGASFGLDYICGTNVSFLQSRVDLLVDVGVFVAGSAINNKDPRGTYTPAAGNPPNGSRNFSVLYEITDTTKLGLHTS